MSSSYDLCPEFVATREETCELARFWLGELYNLDIFYLTTGCTGGSENRRHIHARQRLAALEKIIGEEEIQRINDQVAEKYRERVGDRDWRVLTSGDTVAIQRR